MSPLLSQITPTVETRLAAAEGGIGCVATASGMSAWVGVFAALLGPGDELVVGAGVPSSAMGRLRQRLDRMGVATRFADLTRPETARQVVTPSTRMIFVETVGAPGLEVPDFWSLAEIASYLGIPFVVDNTVTTPAIVRPGELGADVVLRASGTTCAGREADLGGAIVDTGRFDWAGARFPEVSRRASQAGELAFLAHVREQLLRDPDASPTPWTSFLMLRELETLSADVRQQCDNARFLALALQGHADLRGVDYPGLETSTFYSNVRRYHAGQGGALVALRLGTEERAFRFLHALDHVGLGGEVARGHTAATHVASTLPRDDRSRVASEPSVPDDLVLLSVGTESFSIIVEDIRQALRESCAHTVPKPRLSKNTAPAR